MRVTPVRGPARWWVAFLLVVSVAHHEGTLLAALGDTTAGTRWADWVDLLVPWAVLGCAAGALSWSARHRHSWPLFAAGAVLYVEGHGIHLAANSIGNVTPTPTGHLWDEVVGHLLWYGGLALVTGVLAGALRLPRPGFLRLLAATLFGVTATTNAIEGGTVAMGFLVAAVFLGWAARQARRPVSGVAVDVAVAYGTSAVLLVAYGVWQRGWPQFSELGWI